MTIRLAMKWYSKILRLQKIWNDKFLDDNMSMSLGSGLVKLIDILMHTEL